MSHRCPIPFCRYHPLPGCILCRTCGFFFASSPEGRRAASLARVEGHSEEGMARAAAITRTALADWSDRVVAERG